MQKEPTTGSTKTGPDPTTRTGSFGRTGGRRSRSGRPSGGTARLAAAWAALLERPAVWVTLWLVLGGWVLLPPGLLFVPQAISGAIAGRDFLAPKDLLLPDEETTVEKQRRAREDVLPVYNFDPGVFADLDRGLAGLFAAGRAAEATGDAPAIDDDRVAELTAASGLQLDSSGTAVLAASRFSPDLEDRLRSLAGQVLRRGVVASRPQLLENRMRGITVRDLGDLTERTDLDLYDRLGFPDDVRELAEAEVRNWSGLAARQRRALVDFVVANVPPNLHFDRAETEARRAAAAAATAPVFTQIKKGQVIVRKGDQVSGAQARAIALGAGERPLHRWLLPIVGTLFLLALAAAVPWLALAGERVAGHSRRRLFSEALLLLLVSLAGTWASLLVARAVGGSFEVPSLDPVATTLFAVPFAAPALIVALLLGRTPALVLSLVFALLVSRLGPADGGASVSVYAIAGSLAAIFGLERYQVRHRLVLARVGALIGLLNVGIVLVLAALSGGEAGGPATIVYELVGAFVGGLLAAAAAGFALPIFEAVFGLTTDIKLVELANTNLPLLRRVAFEAPGTFQHSLMVANLAKVGCEAIGADPTLAYTGGLYHDIGKVFRPDYFVENQRSGHNRHDKLLPSMSALIIINHVKEGVDLAREHHLPQAIVDAVEQHHGTRLIKFFFHRAEELAGPDGNEVREGDFRYPGPKPQNKVMGVLMLADAVEAASRTLSDASPAKVRGLIRTLIDDCLGDGQLDETDLTLGDLRQVADAFQRVLSTILHKRVDYPGFDFNAGSGRDRRPTAVARAS